MKKILSLETNKRYSFLPYRSDASIKRQNVKTIHGNVEHTNNIDKEIGHITEDRKKYIDIKSK